MYALDLMKAELLVSLANSANAVRKDSNSNTVISRLNDLACTSLEAAQKLILNAKQDITHDR